MVKPKSDVVKKQLRQQDDDVYGDQAPGGSMQDLESDDDVEEVVKVTMGNDAIEDIKHDEYNFHMELEEDEKGAGGITTAKRAKELIKKDARRGK